MRFEYKDLDTFELGMARCLEASKRSLLFSLWQCQTCRSGVRGLRPALQDRWYYVRWR